MISLTNARRHDRCTLAILLRSILCLFLSAGLCAAEGAPPPDLVAYSLSAARRSMEDTGAPTPEVRNLGNITRIWGVCGQAPDDLIIVGECDPSLPGLSIDDAVVALRTAASVSEEDNPGVSIQPLKTNRYSPYQQVKYFAGIDSTHYGTVCLEADLLLKYLGSGLLDPGLGLPNNWDLSLHNAKAGREIDPFGRHGSQSWFFPLNIGINRTRGGATVTSITLGIQTDPFHAVTSTRGRIGEDADSIEKLLKRDPDSGPGIVGQLYTQRLEDLSNRYPILHQLANLLALSGLMSVIENDPDLGLDLSYWKDEFPVEVVHNPRMIPTLSRADRGLGYSLIHSGQVRSVYVPQDAWTDAVCARDARYLKQAALAARPSSEAVSWAIPLGYGAPRDWNDDILTDAFARHERTLVLANESGAGDEPVRERLLETHSQLRPTDTEGWNPSTTGNNMVGVDARMFANYGGTDYFLGVPGSIRPSITVSAVTVDLGAAIALRWLYANYHEIELRVPFKVVHGFADRPGSLPGFTENAWAYVWGMSNPTLTQRFMVFDGIRNGRFLLPWVSVEHSYTSKHFREYGSGQLSGEDTYGPYEVALGQDYDTYELGMNVTQPLSDIIYLSGRARYIGVGDWPVEFRKGYLSASLNWRFSDAGASCGLYHSTILSRALTDSWEIEGRSLLAFLSIPGKSGSNSFYVGWQSLDTHSETVKGKGALTISMDLSAIRLLDFRYWF